MWSPSRRLVTATQEDAHAGQALVEYLLVISVIALVCLPAFAFLQGGIARAYGAQTTALNAPNIGTTTAAPALTYTYPASDEQCKQGQWQTYVTPAGTFKNQGDCQSWVATNGKNAPATPATPTATPLYAVPTATATPVVAYVLPADEDECKKGGWRTFYTPDGTFKNQGDCQSWVATNGRNAPARTPTP